MQGIETGRAKDPEGNGRTVSWSMRGGKRNTESGGKERWLEHVLCEGRSDRVLPQSRYLIYSSAARLGFNRRSSQPWRLRRPSPRERPGQTPSQAHTSCPAGVLAKHAAT